MGALGWLNITSIILSTFGTIVVAVATVVLCRVTHGLFKETKRLADISSQPHVVATIEPSPWSVIHVNFHIENTGNATAYDIEIEFDPPLDDVKSDRLKNGVAFQRVSALKPGKEFVTMLGEVRPLFGRSFNVTTSWRRVPKTGARETNAYVLDFKDYDGLIRLGPADPLIKIADQVAGIREDWRNIAKGNIRVQVDQFTSKDREKREREIEKMIRVEEAGQRASRAKTNQPTDKQDV